MLNYSEPCERNKAVILAELAGFFEDRRSVLEVGSGSGQHALYFAEHLPYLNWQPSDLPELLQALAVNIQHFAQPNVASPLALNVTEHAWLGGISVDAVYTANTLHIMPAYAVEHFFRGVQDVLSEGGKVCIYGPFKYDGQFTTASNEQFDAWLKRQNPLSGIRDFEWILGLAEQAGLKLITDVSMPANNQLLKLQAVKALD